MATKRGTKATRQGKKMKDLRLSSAAAQRAKGGTGGTFEIMDFSFGAGNSLNLGSAGDSAGKVSFSGLKIRKK